jgi:hypothetical protein
MNGVSFKRHCGGHVGRATGTAVRARHLDAAGVVVFECDVSDTKRAR